ncbi:unnamed protein product, partial [Didymodactylos carnosus]
LLEYVHSIIPHAFEKTLSTTATSTKTRSKNTSATKHKLPPSTNWTKKSIVEEESEEEENEELEIMSILFLSFDNSVDKIGLHLYDILNSNYLNKKLLQVHHHYCRVASFCSSKQLFLLQAHDDQTKNFEQIITSTLKNDCLSTNDILALIILVDIATTQVHFKYKSKIDYFLRYLRTFYPLHPILTFFFHSKHILYKSPLTCFNFAFMLSTLYPIVDGIIFYDIDEHNLNDEEYYTHIAQNISTLFLPVSSLRNNNMNKSVCIELLQLIQHLVINEDLKLIDFTLIKLPLSGSDSLNCLRKKYSQSWSQQNNIRKCFSSILISRGKLANQSCTKDHLVALERILEITTSNKDELMNCLDIWNHDDESKSTWTVLVNHTYVIEIILEDILKPCKAKMMMNNAYFYWLKKKYNNLINIEQDINNALNICEQITDHYKQWI